MTEEHKPTPKQDKLFLLHIRNFAAKSSEHPVLLENSFLKIPVSSFNDWVNNKNFPEMAIRMNVMDFIWTHGDCACK